PRPERLRDPGAVAVADGVRLAAGEVPGPAPTVPGARPPAALEVRRPEAPRPAPGRSPARYRHLDVSLRLEIEPIEQADTDPKGPCEVRSRGAEGRSVGTGPCPGGRGVGHHPGRGRETTGRAGGGRFARERPHRRRERELPAVLVGGEVRPVEDRG